MANILESGDLTVRPEGMLLTLRGDDCDVSAEADDAVDRALRDGVAATRLEVLVGVAQDGLPVHAKLEVWDDDPGDAPQPFEQGREGRYLVDFSSRYITLGRGSEWIGGDWLPTSGLYIVDVVPRGREEARRKAIEISETTSRMSVAEAVDYQEAHGSGIEMYRIRLWPGRPSRSSTNEIHLS